MGLELESLDFKSKAHTFMGNLSSYTIYDLEISIIKKNMFVLELLVYLFLKSWPQRQFIRWFPSYLHNTYIF